MIEKDDNIKEAAEQITKTLKAVSTSMIGQKYPSAMISVEKDEESYPGFEVAIKHQLSPYVMKLNFNMIEDNRKLSIYSSTSQDEGYKYIFKYNYLDLYFTIRINDDKIAAQLFPFFSDKQKTQLWQ